jgi:GDPmannose 4,6-dehydratase
MLQQEEPGDYVIGTGESHSVRDFVQLAFGRAGLDWREHVEVDPRYLRPCEVNHLLADASKARRVLAWEPSVGFGKLVSLMVSADMHAIERALNGGREALAAAGYLAAGR